MPKFLDPVQITEEMSITACDLSKTSQQDRKLLLRAIESKEVEPGVVLAIVNLIFSYVLQRPLNEPDVALWPIEDPHKLLGLTRQ